MGKPMTIILWLYTVAPALIGVTAALAAAIWYVTAQRHKRHVTAQQLLRRAEYENRLCARGDPRGLWGQYPPERTHP